MQPRSASFAIFCMLPCLVACQTTQSPVGIGPQTKTPPQLHTAQRKKPRQKKANKPSQPRGLAVVSAHPQASQAAMSILLAGGSAADAAIAGMAALGVVHPVSSGLGGGGVVLHWQAKNKQAMVVDFRATAAQSLDPNRHQKRPSGSQRGALVGTPGQAAGWAELHKRWGKLPFAKLLAPAIGLAREGFRPSRHLQRSLQWNRAWLIHSRLAKVLLKASHDTSGKARMRNPALAGTLMRLANDGPQSLYQGRLAEDIVVTARAAGGELERSDLAQYRAVVRKPLSIGWKGHRIHTVPAPSGGGLLLLQLLKMHQPAELRALGYGSGAYLHRLAASFRGSIADRMRAVGDPAFWPNKVQDLLAPARLQKRKASFAPNKTRSASAYGLDEHGTSHLLVVDARGNVASVTCSVGSMFGARLITRGGFALNDALGNFSHARSKRRFASRGRHNIPRAGARPAYSWTPTVAVKDGEVRFAYGASGGMHIPTAVAQVLLATLLFEREPQQAVSDLRIRLETGGTLWLPPATPSGLRLDLRARGEVHRSDMPNYSAVQVLAIQPQERTRIAATGDRRKGSAVQLR